VSLAGSSISLVVMPKTTADEHRLEHGLRQMMAEDPRLHALRDPQTGHTLISAGDIQHLEGVVDRLKRQFNVEAGLGKPTTAGDAWPGRPGAPLN
jgi:elongation factor G